MHASASVQRYIDLVAPGTSWRSVQPVGPSPLIVKKSDLARLTPRWLDFSLKLKVDPGADKRFGWVLEMWGYSIAAASLGLQHDVLHTFQVEGGAGISADAAKSRGVYIFHYTYGIEYRLDGRPQGPNQIGAWSLDKRHYGAAYPPRGLQPPPDGASDGATWLCAAWNEASQNIPTWPKTRALGTVGWRRSQGDGIAESRLAKAIVNTEWKWAGIAGLAFHGGGALKTPWGTGVWGALPSNVDYNDDGHCSSALGCLFADFGGGLHNLRFESADGTLPPSDDAALHSQLRRFKSFRVGDADAVEGERTDVG